MLRSGFFRENFVTILGIALPLLLVAVFALARVVSEAAVAAPEYKAVYAQSGYMYGGKFIYRVSPEKKLVVIYEGPRTNGPLPTQAQPVTTTVYVTDAKTGAVTKHSYTMANAFAQGVTTIDTKDFDLQVAAQGPTAPDGYVFTDGKGNNYNYSGGILPEIFGYNGRYGSSDKMIVKSGRSFELESVNNYDPFEFIGWTKD